MQRQEGRPTHSTSQHGQVHMSDQYSGMRLSPVVSLPMASLMQGSKSGTSHVVSIGDDFRFPARLLVQTLQLQGRTFQGSDRRFSVPFSLHWQVSGPQPPPWLDSSCLQDSNLSHAHRCTRQQVSNTMTVLSCDHAVDQIADFQNSFCLSNSPHVAHYVDSFFRFLTAVSSRWPWSHHFIRISLTRCQRSPAAHRSVGAPACTRKRNIQQMDQYRRVVLVDHALAQYYAVVGAGGHTADQRSRRGIVSHSGAGGTASGPRCCKLPKSGAGRSRRSQEATPENREY